MKIYGRKKTGENKRKKESEEMQMDIYTFGENVINELAQKLCNCSFMQNEVIKNNGTIMHGLIIQKDTNTGIEPQFYLDGFYESYQNGRNLEEIVQYIVELYKEQEHKKIHQFDVAWMMNFENVKDTLCFRLVNLEKNKELLQTIPYREFLDLAMVYYLKMDVEEDTDGYVRVTNHLMSKWGVKEEQLYKQALLNTPIQNKGIVVPLESLFSEKLQRKMKCNTYESELFDITLNESLFYIGSNASKSYGAVIVLYPRLLEYIAGQLGDLYILPSSVHEVLFLRASKISSFCDCC